MQKSLWRLVLLSGLLFGCQHNEQSSIPLSTPTAVSVTHNTPATPTILTSETISEQQPLTIWLLANFSPVLNSPTQQMLTTQFRQFEEQHPEVSIEIHQKADEGEASLFTYLRSVQLVAPTLLPDIILIDTRQLWQVMELGLLAPVQTRQFKNASAFFPFALESVQEGQQLYAIPYFADILHLAYQQTLTSPPLGTLSEAMLRDGQFAIPTSGFSGGFNDWLAFQYVEASGHIPSPEQGIDQQALIWLFSLFQQNQTEGPFAQGAPALVDSAAIWSALVTGEIKMASVSSHQFLSQTTASDGLSYTPLPTRSGSGNTIAHVWAFAVVTQDAQRQSLAYALLDQLLLPEVQGKWTQHLHWLPTQSTAMTQWSETTPYTQFLQQQLEDAIALPGSRWLNEFTKQLQQAQSDLLQGKFAPDQILIRFQ
jgi:ABC-type glycerol-3-phosphate transport system substrate-binding protein